MDELRPKFKSPSEILNSAFGFCPLNIFFVKSSFPKCSIYHLIPSKSNCLYSLKVRQTLSNTTETRRKKHIAAVNNAFSFIF